MIILIVCINISIDISGVGMTKKRENCCTTRVDTNCANQAENLFPLLFPFPSPVLALAPALSPALILIPIPILIQAPYLSHSRHFASDFEC